MKQSISWHKRIWTTFTDVVWKGSRIWMTGSAVAGCIIGIRASGLLQTWELQGLDVFFRLRPLETIDDRVVIVGIGEEDLQQMGWPLSDDRLVEVLQKIQAAHPRAIGLDLYRDLPVEPGYEKLGRAFQSMPNLIGIEQLKDSGGNGVAPPPVLKNLGQVGFNNVIYDSDGKVRRSLLYWNADGRNYQSFALKLALLYLKSHQIQAQAATINSRYLQLGSAVFPKLKTDDGVYVQTDAGGYQIFANFRGPAKHFSTISIQQLLDGQVPPSVLNDRIVLIGSTATSLKDFSATPYSNPVESSPELMAGVEIQANFVSQILSAALDERPLLQSWLEPAEWFWIWIWAMVGTSLSWQLRSPRRTVFAIVGMGVGLTGAIYVAFLSGWIVPLIPALLGLLGSAIVVIGMIAHSEEELKRSKEFLYRIINSIPDPVFVKDKYHRWIVLNEAYSKFLGKPIADLIEKSDYDVFPKHEADIFRTQDALVFKYEHELEHEEEFTTITGVTHHIATKRSLHKDAAGNLFLVGVIRDITERKCIEEELRRTTVELSRSNAELRLSQDRLHYLASHDALTGLPNRNLFYERLTQCMEWARINHQVVGVLFLDLDGFKQINDTLGHGVGDLLLQAVAKRLSGCLRMSDTIARLGGDEFVVLLPALPDGQNVTKVADKILGTLSQAFAVSGQTLFVTTSIGISLFPNHGDNLELLIQKADEAMYEAKKSGKNRYALATAVEVGR